MKHLLWLVFALTAGLLRAAENPTDATENAVTELIRGSEVTVVHFWAPWCPNCLAEMVPDGWAKFIGENPGVRFIFINVWHKGQDPERQLHSAGLGPQPNLHLLTHPNPARLEKDRLKSFLGLPLTWIPTTWIYRRGQLSAAFNYGEIRFVALQQMLDDARNEWSR